MSIEVVNGYVCKSCCDVALAKKGVDPAHPKDDPANSSYDPKIAAADKAKAAGVAAPPPAVVFGGQLAGLNKATAVIDPNGTPTSTQGGYTPGKLASLTA
jgi:hypothetical protein